MRDAIAATDAVGDGVARDDIERRLHIDGIAGCAVGVFSVNRAVGEGLVGDGGLGTEAGGGGGEGVRLERW